MCSLGVVVARMGRFGQDHVTRKGFVSVEREEKGARGTRRRAGTIWILNPFQLQLCHSCLSLPLPPLSFPDLPVFSFFSHTRTPSLSLTLTLTSFSFLSTLPHIHLPQGPRHHPGTPSGHQTPPPLPPTTQQAFRNDSNSENDTTDSNRLPGDDHDHHYFLVTIVHVDCRGDSFDL